MSIKDLIFRHFGQKYDFLHFWTDDCSLKRAKCRNYRLCTLTGLLKVSNKVGVFTNLVFLGIKLPANSNEILKFNLSRRWISKKVLKKVFCF